MSNTHQLAMAWMMYAQANRGRLHANPSSNTSIAGVFIQPNSFSWIGDGTDPSQGLLWPYVRDVGCFCPNLPGLGSRLYDLPKDETVIIILYQTAPVIQ